MPTDDIISEIRAYRESYAARFGYDIAAMVRDLRERSLTSGHPLADLEPRPRQYVVVLEPTADGFTAHSPDFAGCAATGADRAEATARLRDAIAVRVKALAAEGKPVPPPACETALLDLPAA